MPISDPHRLRGYWWPAIAAVVREFVRAAAFPWHALLYLPRAGAAHAASRRAVTAAPSPVAIAPTCQPASNCHVLLSAGEASGELHALNLMRACAKVMKLRWTCFGGTAMSEQGGRLVFPLSEHAIMGLKGVLAALPRILRAYREFLNCLDHDRPDVVVLVDYPGLHLVFGRAARKRGIRVVHYIAPQYWAWAPWRVRRYRHCADSTWAILPFEPSFFAAAGMVAHYLGNPLLDHLAESDEVDDRYRGALLLMPGSRRAEIEAHLPGMLAVAKAVLTVDPSAKVVVAHREPRRAARIQELIRSSGVPAEFRLGTIPAVARGAKLALVKSGTGSLEVGLLGTPAVVVYQMASWWMRWMHRHYLTVPYFAAANLIAGKAVMPEFLLRSAQDWSQPEQEVLRLWQDDAARQIQRTELALMRTRLGPEGANKRAVGWLAHELSSVHHG